jgi:hypothetical protein
MTGIVFVFFDVTGILALMIHRILF